ncbi:hypothetical protein F5888DRAFT_1639281 [Russula emetica]|nr:hypothetical protein F5888DRAFT_1639281 [Russula emetica]
MKIAREQEEAANEAKALKGKKAVDRVAAIEKQIIEDKNDRTPRPALPHMHSQTRSTTRNPLFMAESSDGLCPASNSLPVDEYQPSCSDSNADDTLSVDEETPVKKKARTDKPSFRDAVKKVQENNTQAVVHDARSKLCRTNAVADLAGPRGDDIVSNKTQPGASSSKKAAGVIKNWTKAVEVEHAPGPNSSKTGSGASSVRSTSANLKKSTTTDVTSVISDKITIAAAEDEEAKEVEQCDNDACRGVADEFELDDPEGGFATLSPIKGKKRVTNDNLVKAKRVLKRHEGPKSDGTRRPRRYRNEDLPQGSMDKSRFRQRFIPTVFWYAASSPNPWNITNQDAENALLCIWKAVYKGTVGDMNDAVMAITTQRLCDSYHSVIASAAVSILADMINSDTELDTDEKLEEFCGMALQDDFFIYSNADFDDPKTYTGPFHNPLVVRTFATHFSAIHGAIKVPALGDANSPDTYPCGSLALSAPAMARALTLCKTGVITIDRIRVSKESSKPIIFTKPTNRVSGKESFKETAFSFATWGLKTTEYLAMIREDLRESSRQKIKAQAYEYYKSNRSQSSLVTASALSMDIDVPEHPCRRILDLSDDE